VAGSDDAKPGPGDDWSFDPFPRYTARDPLQRATARRHLVLSDTSLLRRQRPPDPLPRLVLLYSQPHEEERPPADESPDEQKLQWIAFRVIDDATEEPCAGVQLKIKLPSGEVRDFTTDGSGRVRIDGLQPGTCDIQKMLDDKAFEVVKVV